MARVYDKRQWRRLREQQLRREPLCAACHERGLTVPATDVDHIVTIAAGGEVFDFDNLQSLCHACHSAKTRNVDTLGRAGVPIKGCRADGSPLDPRHWWTK